jgi:hypothetical protein
MLREMLNLRSQTFLGLPGDLILPKCIVDTLIVRLFLEPASLGGVLSLESAGFTLRPVPWRYLPREGSLTCIWQDCLPMYKLA